MSDTLPTPAEANDDLAYARRCALLANTWATGLENSELRPQMPGAYEHAQAELADAQERLEAVQFTQYFVQTTQSGISLLGSQQVVDAVPGISWETADASQRAALVQEYGWHE